MNKLKLAALGFAVAALTGAGFTQTALAMPGMKMSAAQHKKMESCMAMPHDAMMKNAGCTAMMKKMKMSSADMQKMTSCKAMSHDEMMKDQSCMSMHKMNSDMHSDMKK